jgi:hypothetical protein
MPIDIKAQPGPQTDFLDSEADVCIYGGSAGGGKSFGLLLDPLYYLLHVPGFSGVIFRRTYPEIVLPGGLWDTSVEVYKDFGAVPRQGALDWTFPPFGNTMSFHHLQHEVNKYQWQGSQVTYFGFDELTHFTESAFTYIAFSRGRSQCDIDSYVRCSCNPDPGWVKSFLAPWVDHEYPNPARSGEVRYFLRQDGVIRWVDRGTLDCKSMSFIRASVYDNPIMLARNPGYVANLKALLPVERARLLDGDWDVRREGLVYSGFQECIVESARDVSPTVGGIDFGFSNPFACVYGYLDYDDCLWITGCRYIRQCTTPIHAESIPKGVKYWCDPAQPESRLELVHAGHECLPCLHIPARGAGGEKRNPILHGIDLVSARIARGKLKIIRNDQTKWLIREAAMYHYDTEKHDENPVKEDDHAMDALRYLIVGLDRGKVAPAPETNYEKEMAEREAIAVVDEKKRLVRLDAAAQSNIEDPRWWGGDE